MIVEVSVTSRRVSAGLILVIVAVTEETVTKMIAFCLMRLVKECPFVDLGLRKKNLLSLRIRMSMVTFIVRVSVWVRVT